MRSDSDGDRLNRFLEMFAVTRNSDHAHARPLPNFLMIQFGDGHVEMRAQPVFQAAKHLPLVFEGLRIRDVNFQGEKADRHFRSPENAVERKRTERRASIRTKSRAENRRLTRSRDALPPPLCGRAASLGLRFYRRRPLFDLEAFEDIADFHVVEIRDAHAALESGAHFAGVFLESPQRTELPV